MIDEDFDLEEIASDADASFIGMDTTPAAGISAFDDTTSSMRDRESNWTDLERYVHDETRPEYRRDSAQGSFRTGMRYRKAAEDPFGKYWSRYIGGFENGMKATILAEHDPEEPRAVDYLSASVTIPAPKVDGCFIAGDYRPSFGEGLVFSRTARRYRAGTDIVQRIAANPANVSFEESHYLRGAFVRLGGGRYGGEAWVSRRTVDGVEEDDGDIVSIDRSGLHTNRNGRADVTERIGAAKVSVKAPASFVLSALGAVSDYSPGFVRRTGERSSNDPEGERFQHLSISGTTHGPGKTFFFEHARMTGGADATTAGLRVGEKRFSGVVLARSYDRDWWAPRSGAISAFGESTNERGVYAAVEAAVSSSSRLTASMDLARTLGRTYLHPMPVSRRSVFLGIDRRMAHDGEYGIAFRSSDDSSGDPGRWSVRARCSRSEKVSGYYSPRAILAWSSCGGDGGPFVEIGYGYRRNKLRLDIGVDVFAIPEYSARYYRYERDVPGRGMSLPVWGDGGSCTVRAGMGRFTFRYRILDSDLMAASRELSIQGDWLY